ncbi:hypothetical protein ABPG74_018865 [Tetrahymena malaccensis]
MGRKSFEIYIIIVDYGVFETISSFVDTNFGGDNFDQRVSDYFANMILKKNNKDIFKDERAMQKLIKYVEIAKKRLSFSDTTQIKIDDIFEGFNIDENLTREKFEEINSDLFNEIINKLQTTLESSGLEKADIDQVIFSGGFTQNPKIRDIVQNYLEIIPQSTQSHINQDKVTVYGLTKYGYQYFRSLFSTNLGIYPLQLGIETLGGIITPIVPYQTLFPFQKSKIFSINQDYQSTFTVKVYQGARPLARDNFYLGSFDLDGIPPAPKGIPQIEISFKMNHLGDLDVIALGKLSGVTNQIRFNKQDLEIEGYKLVKIGEERQIFQAKDQIDLENIQAKNKFESFFETMKDYFQNKSQTTQKLSVSEEEKIQVILNQTQEWIDNNPQIDKYQYELRKKEDNRKHESSEVLLVIEI